MARKLKYFTLDEFDSPDKPGSGKKMDWRFLEMLDETRENAAIPFVINSGYRTKARNKKVGGKKNSAHRKGLAADIECNGSRERYNIVVGLLTVGFTRIGIGKTFVHVDYDEDKPQHVIWTY